MSLILRILSFYCCLSLLASCHGFALLSKQSRPHALTATTTSSTSSPPSPLKVAIILVDHGSRKSEANNMLMEVADKYKKLYNIEIVEAAHMELSEPSISTAFRKCIDQGANKIICHPFFLSKGRHVQEDIPEMMRAAAAEHVDVLFEYSITEPLGVQEKILELIHQSIINVVDDKLLS